MPVIGVLDARSPGTTESLLRAFRQGLKDTSYVEGENVALEYRWADNELDRLPGLAADLAGRKVAIIAAFGNAAARAAKAATTTIPVAFAGSSDPVAVDRIELETVEAKRREKGAPSLWDRDPAHLDRENEMRRNANKNRFYREPGHIRTAAEMGLGTWEIEKIRHLVVEP